MIFFLKIKHWQLFLLTTGLYLVAAQFFVVVALNYYLFIGMWVYAIVNKFRSKLPQAVVINFPMFRSSLIFYMLYQFLMISIFEYNGRGNIFLTMSSIVALFCMIYSNFVAATVFLAVESREQPPLRKVFVVFLGLLFSFIGVWFLQPRINKLSEQL